MSEAILAFQSQLSGVMESVLKAAMYEIVRLVEDSFLEEVSRSRQQVESLKRRLQWSEGRRKEREADGRSRCVDCGRAGVCSEDGSMETELGSEEGHGLKQENVLEGNWSSCPRDTMDPVPCAETEESAAVSPTKAPEPADLVDVGRDSALKVEDLLAAPCSVRLQENCGVRVRLQENCGVCVVGEFPKGVSGAPTLDHHNGLQHCDKEPSSAVRHALPSSSESEQSVRRLYSQEPGSGHERLGLTGAQSCVVDLDGEDKPHERVGQRRPAFSPGSGDFRSVRAESEPDDSGMSSPDVKLHVSVEDFLCIKQEEEEEEEEITDAPQTHRRDSGTRADAQTENAYELSPQEVLKLHGACSEGCSLALLSGRSLREAVSDAAVESNLDKSSCVSYDKCFVMSKNTQAHHSVCTIEKRFGSIHFGKSFTQLINVKTQLKQHTEKSPLGCTQCGKSFSHLCHLKAHQQTHTGERPFICTLCGRSFTKLSNLKAHRRVHTGERPYICTDCGKRFTQKCNLKRHQRIHAAERLLSCN